VIGLSRVVPRGVPALGATPADVVHAEHKWRLLRYRRATATTGAPVLLVPSLINRHYVLDLMPGKSLVEHLLGVGHDVYLVDWGRPGPEDRWLEFADWCDRYIERAVRRACACSGARAVHLVGYCLGGTLAAIYTALHPDRVQSLTGIAAPIDFHDDGLLSVWMRARCFDPAALADAFGNVPWPIMQAAFHLLRPTQALRKLVRLFDRAHDDEFVDGFLAVERWGADNVSFPGGCFREYIGRLYRDNALVHDALVVDGRPVRLAAIRCPTLAVTFADDHIVPWRGAATLLERISSPDKQHLHLPGGHVGAVVSRKASRSLWPALSGFWTEHDEEPSAPRPRAVASS
jgi:polyhydroxyalkanoate synthase